MITIVIFALVMIKLDGGQNHDDEDDDGAKCIEEEQRVMAGILQTCHILRIGTLDNGSN